MKHAAYWLMAAFLAHGVYGAIPDSAEGWYTPSGGFTATSGTGTIYYGYDKKTGEWQTAEVTVDDDGNITGDDGVDFQRNFELKTAYEALVKACLNEATLANHAEAIEAIGENLYELTTKTGFRITDATGQSHTIRLGGTIAQAAAAAEDGLLSATSSAGDPTDGLSTSLDESRKIQLLGWRTDGTDTMTPLAEAITKPVKGTLDDYDLVVRNSSKGLNYVALGTLAAGGAPVDGVSITTNETDGAITQGEASLHHFATALDWAMPYKHGEGGNGELWWRTPDQWCGDSLEWGDDGIGNKKFNVVGANDYAGKHSRHYFGTSNDKSAVLGWHELPNITTNRVEGDNITIASTVDNQDPGLKRLGLLGWNKSWSGDPLFVVNAGGSVGYIPFPAITNLAACACTQKWDNVTEWIGGDAAVDEDGGLTLPEDSLDDYLFGTLGYIYSTTANNLHFDNDGDTIQASFDAPENWADGDSVELADGAYQVAGWADASACNASVSAMLSNPTGSDATTHLLLAKKTDSGEMHYVSIGDGVTGGAAVDDTTITTNTAHGASTPGIASIYGWSGAANDTYLSKNESGALEWREVEAVPGVDGASIATNSTGSLVVSGFSAAADGAIPYASNGSGGKSLQWANIAAGYGMRVENSNGSIVVSSTLDTPDTAGAFSQITYVSDIRYDATTHQLTMTKTTVSAKILSDATTQTVTVFTATPHSADHNQSE